MKILSSGNLVQPQQAQDNSHGSGRRVILTHPIDAFFVHIDGFGPSSDQFIPELNGAADVAFAVL